MHANTLLSRLRPMALSLLIMTAATTQALAQQMVSVKGSVLNMREGPSTRSQVLWELKQGYPLQVVERRGRWLKVRDFESDQGWVAASLTGRQPHHVVKASVAHVRSGPSTQHAIVGKAEYGELVRTREKRAGWVKVTRTEGASGWIARRLLWGW